MSFCRNTNVVLVNDVRASGTLIKYPNKLATRLVLAGDHTRLSLAYSALEGGGDCSQPPNDYRNHMTLVTFIRGKR